MERDESRKRAATLTAESKRQEKQTENRLQSGAKLCDGFRRSWNEFLTSRLEMASKEKWGLGVVGGQAHHKAFKKASRTLDGTARERVHTLSGHEEGHPG